MSTNYYAVTQDTPEGDEGLHIGQAAIGWVFLFRAHPELGLTTARAWHEWLEVNDAEITDEHGSPIDRGWFWELVSEALLTSSKERYPGLAPGQSRAASYGAGIDSMDLLGYSFSDYEFC